MLQDHPQTTFDAKEGYEQPTNNSTNQTLGAKKIESNSSLSTLSRISYNASHGITQLYNWAAEFLGLNYECSYELNKEFLPDQLDAQQVVALMQQVQFGLMPKEALWEVNRKNGITDPSVAVPEVSPASILLYYSYIGVEPRSFHVANLIHPAKLHNHVIWIDS